MHGVYKTHPNFNQQVKKKNTNIKGDGINIMNIINDKSFNLLKSFFK